MGRSGKIISGDFFFLKKFTYFKSLHKYLRNIEGKHLAELLALYQHIKCHFFWQIYKFTPIGDIFITYWQINLNNYHSNHLNQRLKKNYLKYTA